jgi:purine-binding chemotaxis protein CheW
MVDLVKIRKKKEEGRRQKAEGPPPEPAAPPPTQDSGLRTQDSSKLERFKQEAGKKREGFLREAADTTAERQLEVLTFALAGEHYAVGIEHIVEIVTPRVTTRVPNADPSVVGIISLRGLIVTVVDVRGRLHHPPSRGADVRVVVVERNGETLGFEVDRVLRVVKVDPAAVEPHPVVHSSESSDAIRGVFQHAGALTILLDLDKLLA